jgi:hypothetical protein
MGSNRQFFAPKFRPAKGNLLAAVLGTVALATVSLGIAAPAQAAPVEKTQALVVSTVDPSGGASGVPVADGDAGALATPWFRIYFGQNCASGGTANHYYPGYNAGEAWINDTFNDSSSGSSGYGQTIRNNAASVLVNSAAVWISSDGGFSFTAYNTSGSQCFNLGDRGQRNANTNWKTQTAF